MCHHPVLPNLLGMVYHKGAPEHSLKSNNGRKQVALECLVVFFKVLPAQDFFYANPPYPLQVR